MSTWGSGAGSGGWDSGTAAAPATSGASWESGTAGGNTGIDDNFGGRDESTSVNGFNTGGDADTGGRGGGGGGCYNCGQDDHMKADCPEPRQAHTGECRLCKKEGHFAKECPDAGPQRCGNCRTEGHHIDECPDPLVCPRCKGEHKVRDCEEPMKCYHCNEEGHLGRDCPTYVATCKNCGQEGMYSKIDHPSLFHDLTNTRLPGHMASTCENARNIDRSNVPDFSGEEAWKMLESAIIERDLDEIKEKVQIYIKAQPETTFPELEKALRAQGYGLYLIPLERTSLAITLTNMDLQGNLGKKYTVNYRLSDKPRRATEKEGWPESHDEILERLADAGDIVPCGLPKCVRCSELGHTSRDCPEEETENDRTVVKCYNCDEEGHRVRDCPIPRVDKFACKNCGKGGHKVADCEEPRSAANVECRKCNEIGHFSKDCPTADPKGCRNCGEEGHMAKECTEPRNMDNVQCRNCDEMGHDSRGCPKPRDYSRIKCSNCQEMGHTKVRCKNPAIDEDGAGGDFGCGDAAPQVETEAVEATGGGGSAW